MENFKWFLYDCEIIFNTKYIHSQNLLDALNSVNPVIKITMVISDDNLPVLKIFKTAKFVKTYIMKQQIQKRMFHLIQNTQVKL